jgi:LuxR family maltose regulon positive regulatory protein
MTDARQDGQTSGRRTRPPGLAPAAWFTAPVVPADHLRRLRLLRLLDRGASSPMVVVSAPAGSGKTALVADWVDFRDLLP